MVSTPRRIVRSNRRVPSQIRTFGHAPNIMPMPNLLGMPKSSYDRFLSHSLRELFDEITPIEDFTGSRMEIRFTDYWLSDPELTETEARDRERTYAAPMRVKVELLVKETGEDLIFLHKITAGGADKSYGIEAARLAGVPKKVLERAREILRGLQQKKLIK